MQKKTSFLDKAAAFIVDFRLIIFILFAGAVVFCAMSVSKVQVSNDLTAFLPAETETRRGLTIMEEEFVVYASEDVMVANVTYDEALRLADMLSEIDGVTGVTFDDTAAHYAHASALFTVGYDGQTDDPVVTAAQARVREALAGYDVYIYALTLSNYAETLAEEMVGVMLIAAAVVLVALLLTSRSYFELLIFAVVFIVAALLNLGTNYWLGTISAITSTIAVIMQLALAIDYAIIFCHRYHDEAEALGPGRPAVVASLSKAIVEIASSSLTTIAGLLALTLMQFRLGYDLGVVLAKSIVCSMLTVFLLMPGLIMLFPRALAKTRHRSLIPSIRPWGRFLGKSFNIFVWIFLLILPGAFWCAQHANFIFADSLIDELTYSETRATMHKINDTFDYSTYAAILVPVGDYDSEKAILQELADVEGVKDVIGLANIDIDGEHVLTDSFTPRMFAELAGVDIETAQLLYQLYGYEHDEYQSIFGDVTSYSVPLVDMFLFLFEKMDEGLITLDGETAEMITPLRDTLRRGVEQLRGENWDRLVLTVTVPPQGAESEAFIEQLRAIAERYYGEGSVLVIGDVTSSRDLGSSYNGDMLRINLLTILFVFIILMFTIRSFVGSVILVFVIQGSIWINFSFIYLLGMNVPFMVNLMVTAIQMGATIDYAIVLMNRYLNYRRDGLEPKQAMIEAVNNSFATLLTSGSIMTVAGFLLAMRISDVYVGHIGLAVGRGALTSIIIVLTVLPQLICLLDKAIMKTSFTISLKGDDPA